MPVAPASLKGRCLWLTAVTGVAWLLMLGPAAFFFGVVGIQSLTFAALVCLVPGLLVFCVLGILPVADMQSWVMIAGGPIRIGCAIGGAWIALSLAGWPITQFLLWLGLFYAATLVIEVWLLMPPATMSKQAIPKQSVTGQEQKSEGV